MARRVALKIHSSRATFGSISTGSFSLAQVLNDINLLENSIASKIKIGQEISYRKDRTKAEDSIEAREGIKKA